MSTRTWGDVARCLQGRGEMLLDVYKGVVPELEQSIQVSKYICLLTPPKPTTARKRDATYYNWTH